jgi:hypothetical protein
MMVAYLQADMGMLVLVLLWQRVLPYWQEVMQYASLEKC